MKIIILAGGSGSRLWPMTSPPKQFAPLFGTYTLFQKTLQRFLKRYRPEDLLIVTNGALQSFATAQAVAIAPQLKPRVIIEPVSKNTAFALLYALEWLREHNELDDEFLVAPSDHLIAPEEVFLDAIEKGREWAKGHLLFGIFPTHPHTGYGYILANLNESLPSVTRFVEKPNAPIAQQLLQTQGCLWNSGIFLFQTEKFFEDLRKTYINEIPPASIDVAFLEHFEGLYVIPLDLSWSDLGSWESVYEVFQKDDQNNVIIGNVSAKKTKNSLIISKGHPLHIEGVENVCIVATEEGLLVIQRQEHQAMLVSGSFPRP